MQQFSCSPKEMVASLWRNRSLIYALAEREVQGRYRGSLLGLLWAFFNPLFLLGVYTFVFGKILRARWYIGSDSQIEFALALFAGLIAFNLFSECINRAPGLILGNVSYVKRVVFPLEVLPFANLLSALFHMLLSVIVWFAVYIPLFGLPHTTALLLPLVILPLVLFIMGLSWVLASLGVFLRDISQFIGMVVVALMFLSPIFYPVTAFPEEYRHLMYLNPLTPVIEMVRDVLFWGRLPDFAMLGIYLLVTALIAWLGFAWFQKTRKGFADVI